jgi:ubiquinone/menaquinone biosynthesis C-methylase UbiE
VKRFCYEGERRYYSQAWPNAAATYTHLEPYLTSWLEPEALFEGKRILEIGAGECGYARVIAERFRPRSIVACELFPERMLPVRRADDRHRVAFVAGDALTLPFRAESFDVTFGSLFLCQMPDLDDAMREIRRVLVTAGRYVGIEPNPYQPLHLYRYFRGRHSPNQYLLGRGHLRRFERFGFETRIQSFYAGMPWLGHVRLGTCLGVVATKRPGVGARLPG